MKWVRHMADYSQKEKELEREHLEKLVKEEGPQYQANEGV